VTDAPAKDRSETRHRGIPAAMAIFLGTVAFAVAATGLVIASTDDIGSLDEQAQSPISNSTGQAGNGGTSAPGQSIVPGQPTQGASAGGDDAGLRAAGVDLLAGTPDAADVVGRAAAGRGVRVQQVVPGEGFFVGTSERDRVYVEFGGDVGEDETSELPRRGDVVDLSGPVRPAPEDPARTLELDDEQAALVEELGFYVNADRVTPAR
jgi:hypothetical protein